MLTITRYLDISPATVADRLKSATTPTPEHAEIRIGGIDDLATVEVVVPWSTDQREATVLAANRFATDLTRELAAA